MAGNGREFSLESRCLANSVFLMRRAKSGFLRSFLNRFNVWKKRIEEGNLTVLERIGSPDRFSTAGLVAIEWFVRGTGSKRLLCKSNHEAKIRLLTEDLLDNEINLRG